MGSHTPTSSHHDRDSDDEEEYEEAGAGNRLLGFMFGNVDNAGELEVDYLDEDAKEHLDALADKLGPSLTDINLSGKSPEKKTGAATATAKTEADYDEKAVDAVDYEDIDEQYEGPETETTTEEDHLLPRREFLPLSVSATTIRSSVYDDENYDEDDDIDEKSEAVACEPEVGTLALAGVALNQGNEADINLAENDPANQEIVAPVDQTENDGAGFDGKVCFKPGSESDLVVTTYSAFSSDLQEESVLAHYGADVRSSTPLPILCLENGMAVLRFSEIFGINEPLRKAGTKEHKYSVSKDKYTSLDSSLLVEEDEDAFLKGSCQVLSVKKPLLEAQDDHGTFMHDNSGFAKFDIPSRMCAPHDEWKDSCLSAEPMKKDGVLDLTVEWQSCMSKEFYTLDQQDWEDRVVWANSPMLSENSVECSELSGPDSESVAHDERESSSLSLLPSPDCRGLLHEKDKWTCTALSSFSVEPFDSRDLSSLMHISSSESARHPQILRLGSRVVSNSSNLSERKEHATEEHKQVDFMKRFKPLMFENKDLVEGSWIENIIWESKKPIAKSKLILDLLDERMVFEVLDNKDYEHLQSQAGAMITTRAGRFGADEQELRGHVALSSGQFNIANDKYYSDRRTSPQLKSVSKKRPANNLKYLHSAPALELQTMKPKLSNKEIANFHRPKGIWYPQDNKLAAKELEKLPTQGPMKVVLKSLGGKAIKFNVDVEDTIAAFKEKAYKKFDYKLTEAVRMYYLGKELEDKKTLAEQNIRPNSLLHLVRTRIHLLPMAQKFTSEKKSLRPALAFKKISDLSATNGHVFLMEYCEERPLLLGNAGMGAKLYTYYQKTSSNDQNGDILRKSNTGVGTVLTLEPDDKSPFLGDIKPGSSQSSLETRMYKAPVFPHRVAPTDYLLVRSSKGKLSIRRIDKIHVVGQQEPDCEVMQPSSKALQGKLVDRLLAFMYREFRAAEKRGMPPRIRADELSAYFPNIGEPLVRKRLRQCADLQKGPNGVLHYTKRRNFHIPPEEEIRGIVRPEHVCAYESMQAGLYRLKRLGITRLATLASPTQLTALTSAMSQLPDEAIVLAAASHIEREIQITPWNLSANFVSCVRQEKGNVERLEISGVGDPSGRGMGFSYVRMAAKPPVSNALVKKKPVVARGSTVTGTDADLRRLSMEASREVLLKFNIPEDQIEKLSRWHRIALIRKLSSEQAASGVQVDPATISKYARGQRMSFLQLQQQAREKCQDIWDRQVQSLSAVDNGNESDSEANSDLDSFAGDLENLLDAEEGEEGEEGIVQMKSCKFDGSKGLKIRRHPQMGQFEELVEDEAAEAAELYRMLMDDNKAKLKKKKNLKPSGGTTGLLHGPQKILGRDNPFQVQPSILVTQTNGTALPGDVLITKQKVESQEIERHHPKKSSSKKKKNEEVPSDLPKKVKITTEGIKVQDSRKSARESFVCGACGQLGHMRTNKHCPKYREDLEAQMNMDPEHGSTNPIPQELSQSQQKISTNKLATKGVLDSVQAETLLEGGKSSLKTKILKVKYASADRVSDQNTSTSLLNLEQPSTSEAEAGSKSFPKAIKIKSNKSRPDDALVESQKLNVVIRPPSEMSRDRSLKRITIKQPRKDVINLDLTSEDGGDVEYRKTKKVTELDGFCATREQETLRLAEETVRKNKAVRRKWEEEERRNMERIKEQAATWKADEEMKALHEQERVAELRKYQESIHREREEEELQKVKKMKKKRTIEFQHDYFEDFQGKKNIKLLPGRNRSAKRKNVVELGRYAADSAPSSKRRRNGEVGLANILEEIVDTLKARIEVSYLFHKPVSKKEAPDYLNIIKRPMDLSTIKDKVRRLEYKHQNEFRHDVAQITINAHTYNDQRNPGIPPLADQLLEICDYLLIERADILEEAEASITDT